MLSSFQPPVDVVRRAESLASRRSSAWFVVAGGGYTQALRLIVRWEDGTSHFVKAATTADTALWLHAEKVVYEALQGSRFLPAYFGFDGGSDGELPILLIEDLAHADWPPPWSTARIDAVLEALAHIRAATSQLPTSLGRAEELSADFVSWHRVAETPEPFLSLGLCSARWLDAALPALIEADERAPIAGDDLLHLDVRSDNLCFRPDGSAVFVDWNWACIGNGALDIACWLPSLQIEGGPPPETMLPDQPEFAALLSGYWAYRAGLPAPNGAPNVRQIQCTQLSSALPWAVRGLGLPPLDR